ncbi:hypothetical protein HOLleu_17617 [Holothuria leucospilota]|uniref:Uncharacterized protein n=1 Tax=Holothuria leucospilota TaxID=206669 RepID=A0A9Q1H8Z1_HOLLE|nr:hypothetical protein HOLleu_17617 [Holothuria leucospilota]
MIKSLDTDKFGEKSAVIVPETGRKRYRTGDEEAQLFHPASKRRDLNGNRDLLDISALSIHASNSVNHTNGTDPNRPNCEAGVSQASGSQHIPDHHHQLGQPPPLHQNTQPSTSQGTLGPSALSRNQSNDSDDDDDDDTSSSYYKDINMILKKAHFDFLQRRKLPYVCLKNESNLQQLLK